MIGSLFMLALTSLVGVSIAMPLSQNIEINYLSTSNQDYDITYHEYGYSYFYETDAYVFADLNLKYHYFDSIYDDGDFHGLMVDDNHLDLSTYSDLEECIIDSFGYKFSMFTKVDVDGISLMPTFDYHQLYPHTKIPNFIEITFAYTSGSVNNLVCYVFNYPLNTGYAFTTFSNNSTYYNGYVGLWPSHFTGLNFGQYNHYERYYQYLYNFNVDLNDFTDLSFRFRLLQINEDNVRYQQGYDDGYSQGREDGYQQGLSEGSASGYTTGHYDGYIQGYQEGLNMATGANFNNLFYAIADTPVVMLRSLFNFDLFGMNVFVIIMSLLTAMIVLYVIKKVWK